MPKQPNNKLRHFADLDDLFDNCSDEQLLEWVNQLAAKHVAQQTYHRRRNLMQTEFVRLAKQMLAEDERTRVAEVVEEELELSGDKHKRHGATSG
jgi:uncharacterized secreted protein with C-terminal beta-propeller domain